VTIAYDLHTHSTASDGTLAPAELVRKAAASGVDVLALTDHDTTAGLAEAFRAAADSGIRLVSGVEISVTWSAMTIHVVGLGFDPDKSALQRGLARLRDFRDWRAAEIGRRLEKAGISGAFEGARRYSSGRLIGRTHFARYLVEQGHAATVRDVFRKFLLRNKPGHVSGQWAALEDAVGWITAAGGQAVIAHPARYRLTRMKLRRLIGEFSECGGEGIEVVSGSHNRDECFTMARHARECGLLASAGSDYHGPENPYTELGRLMPLPHGSRPVWSGWPCRKPPRGVR
jgi:predicted metal-dependent phosphoesterase TrpH